MAKLDMKLRGLTARVSTPICGAKLDTLKCTRHDVTRCSWMCVVELEKDVEDLDLFERAELTEEEMNEMYMSDNLRKELTTNMDREEWS